jgi:hypothetical protein
MKKILILLSVAASVMACKSGDKKAETETTTTTPLSNEEKEKAKADTANYTTLVWLDSTYKELGKLKHDQSVEITYRFKNTGSHNLVIDNVSAQCGCTIPEKPEKAFAPGEEGEIKAKFNGSGSGHIRKEIYVTANTSPSNAHTLAFGGDIEN